MYTDIPTIEQWHRHPDIQRHPLPPGSARTLAGRVDDWLRKYHARSYSAADKGTILNGLSTALSEWAKSDPLIRNTMALKDLRDVTQKKLTELKTSGAPVHRYEDVLCIGYVVDTSTPPSALPDEGQQMVSQCQRLASAIGAAKSAAESLVTGKPAQKTLKIFMAPEFYFRADKYAYSTETVSNIVPTMLPLIPKGCGDWLFVLGTAVAAWQRPDKSTAEVYNTALILKGGEAHLVAKEYVSGIDYREGESTKPGGGWGKVSVEIDGRVRDLAVRPTEGSRDGRVIKPEEPPVDERMGGNIFTWDGITFGLEVCLDHSVERLQGQGTVQVQLIPSCGMSIQNPALNRIIFNVDGNGNDKHAHVYARVSQTPVKTIPGKTGQVCVFGPFKIPYPGAKLTGAWEKP